MYSEINIEWPYILLGMEILIVYTFGVYAFYVGLHKEKE